MIFKMILTFLKGIVIGVCNVIPGVSGGTIVVIFDIYDQFMDITSLNFKKMIKNWHFCLPLILGLVVGILGFSKIITILYTNLPIQTNYFFTGLIIGSIPLLFNYTFKNPDDKEAKKSVAKIFSLILCAIFGLAVIVGFSLLQKKFGDSSTMVSTLPPFSVSIAIKFFIGGFLGAIAMIIPGISGSLLLLILGIYPIVIGAISATISGIPLLFQGQPEDFVHAFVLLIPCVIGILAGLVSGSNLMKLLLKKFPNYTYGVILGLIVGSTYSLFPGFKCFATKGAGCVIGSFICLIAGAAMAYFSARSSTKDKTESVESAENEGGEEKESEE
jgi:putative membrane protein